MGMDSNDEQRLRMQADAEKLSIIGCDLCHSKNFDEALKRFSEAIELSPTNALYYFNRSNCYVEMKCFKEALADVKTCVALDPCFPNGYECQVDFEIALGNLQEASNLLLHTGAEFAMIRNDVIHKQNDLIEAYNSLTSVNDHKLALEAVESALLISKSSVRLKLMKAESLLSLQRFEECEELLKQILIEESMDNSALFVRGKCYLSQKRFDNAIEDFEYLHVTTGNEEFKEAVIRAKIAKAKKQASDAVNAVDFETAYHLYSLALLIDPSNAVENGKIYFNRSVVLGKLGKNRDAINDCSEAIKLDGSYLKAYLRRAKLYSDLNQFEEAVSDYQKVFEMENTEEYASLLVNAMRQLVTSVS